VVQVNLESKKAKYRVVSTVFLKMISTHPASYGDLEIAGNVSRSVSTRRLLAFNYHIYNNAIFCRRRNQ
jgi:transketolase